MRERQREGEHSAAPHGSAFVSVKERNATWMTRSAGYDERRTIGHGCLARFVDQNRCGSEVATVDRNLAQSTDSPRWICVNARWNRRIRQYRFGVTPISALNPLDEAFRAESNRIRHLRHARQMWRDQTCRPRTSPLDADLSAWTSRAVPPRRLRAPLQAFCSRGGAREEGRRLVVPRTPPAARQNQWFRVPARA
jgi:hypothetical protein